MSLISFIDMLVRRDQKPNGPVLPLIDAAQVANLPVGVMKRFYTPVSGAQALTGHDSFDAALAAVKATSFFLWFTGAKNASHYFPAGSVLDGTFTMYGRRHAVKVADGDTLTLTIGIALDSVNIIVEGTGIVSGFPFEIRNSILQGSFYGNTYANTLNAFDSNLSAATFGGLGTIRLHGATVFSDAQIATTRAAGLAVIDLRPMGVVRTIGGVAANSSGNLALTRPMLPEVDSDVLAQDENSGAISLNRTTLAAILQDMGYAAGGAAKVLQALAIDGGALPEGSSGLYPVTATYNDGTTEVLQSGMNQSSTEGTYVNSVLTIPANSVVGDSRTVTLTVSVGAISVTKTVAITDASTPPATGNDVVTITVNYASAPTPGSLTSAKSALLFNKSTAVSLVMDDGLVSALPVQAALAAGSAPTMTDGAGTVLPYTLDLALNARNNYDGSEWNSGGDAGRMTKAQVNGLVAAGWSILNHGEYHGYNGDPIPGAARTVATNVDNMHTYVYSTYGWLCRVGTRPNNDEGYNAAFQSQGYLSGVSQPGESGWVKYPEEWQQPAAVEALPTGYFMCGRIFDDMHNGQASIDRLVNRYLQARANQSASVHPLVVLGMHDSDTDTVLAALQSIHDQASDTVWVAGVHRVLEYRHTVQNTVVTDSLAGNVRTITINFGACSPLARRDDLSLLLGADKAISSATIAGSGATLTFNAGSGLFNVLRPRTFTSINGRPRS